MKKPSEMSDQELAEKYRSLYQRIECNKGGYGTSDLRLYDAVEKETRKRGFIIETKVEIREGRRGEVLVG